MNTNQLIAQTIKAGETYLWNGPVCPTCHRGYQGAHQCTIADLQARVDHLEQMIADLKARQQQPTRTTTPPNSIKVDKITVHTPPPCPCRSFGGQGTCGSVLCGPRVTC